MKIRQAITFDDVLLQPGASEVMPADVDVSTFLTNWVRSLDQPPPVLCVGHNELLLYAQTNDADMDNISTILRPFYYPESDNVQDTSFLRNLAQAVEVFVSPPVFRDSFTFGVVRNPFSRAVSAWRYCCGDISFGQFVEALETHGLISSHWTWHQRVHICLQTPLMFDTSTTPPTRKVNTLLKFEQLESDFQSKVGPVLRQMGSKGATESASSLEKDVHRTSPQPNATQLPRLNVQSSLDYVKVYATDSTYARRIIAIYKTDFECLGYPVTLTPKQTVEE